jgi:large subunit ribosomal protein L10
VALNLQKKQEIVAQVAEIAQQAISAVVVDYRGLTVGELTELRAKARKSGVHLQVVRNTLAKRAFEGTEFACLQDALGGPLLLAFSLTEPSAAARLLKDFAKTHDKLKVKALSIGGQLLAANQLDKVSQLPTKDEAISKLMSALQAPVTKLVRTLVEPHTKMVRLFAAVRDQKQSS